MRTSSSAEMARLQAALKKAELRVAGLEQTVEQKVPVLGPISSGSIHTGRDTKKRSKLGRQIPL